MTDGKYTNPFLAFLILGLLVLGMACSEIYGRASIEAEGLIVGREVVCQQPKNNRCVTNYLLKRADHNSLDSYSAGPTDQSLSSELKIGSTVKKQRWHLKYEVNGKEIDDFPILFHMAWLVIGFLAIGLWIFKMINKAR